MESEKMIKSVDLKCGIAYGFVSFAITLFFVYLATGTLDLRFPAVIGTGFFGGGILGSMLKRLYKEGEERRSKLILLAVILVVSTPLIAIFAFAYLISYGAFRVMKSEEVKNDATAPPDSSQLPLLPFGSLNSRYAVHHRSQTLTGFTYPRTVIPTIS